MLARCSTSSSEPQAPARPALLGGPRTGGPVAAEKGVPATGEPLAGLRARPLEGALDLPQASPQWRFPRWLTFGLLPFLLSLAVAMAVTSYLQRPKPAPPRPSATPAGVPTKLADLMSLSKGTGGKVPAFRLTDQRGATVSLSQFRGRAVVLTFVDASCAARCRWFGREVRGAERALGASARDVAFVAVDVNRRAASRSDLAAFTRSQGLSSLPNWFLLAGPERSLRAVWRSYGVNVVVVGAKHPVYADYVLFVDPAGRERYVADPAEPLGSNPSAGGSVSAWGRGIATVAERALGS